MLAEELGYREEEQDLSSHASEAPSSLGSVSKWTKRTQDDNTPTYAALFFFAFNELSVQSFCACYIALSILASELLRRVMQSTFGVSQCLFLLCFDPHYFAFCCIFLLDVSSFA
jgi:hypothetical protein